MCQQPQQIIEMSINLFLKNYINMFLKKIMKFVTKMKNK